MSAIRDIWREKLVALGFSDNGACLRGPVRWVVATDAAATAHIEVALPSEFPFVPPRVHVLDPGAPLEMTFHIDRDGALCLWEDEWAVDEAPWLDPLQLIARVADWLAKTAASWPGDDSCDLERYLEYDWKALVLYDASDLVFDKPVRTAERAEPPTLTVTNKRREPRAQRSGRGRRRRDTRLCWVSDIGPVTRPLRCWTDVAGALGARADEVAPLIRSGVISFLLLTYTHGDAPGVLALRVRASGSKIELSALESADTSLATRTLRAGATAPQLAGVRVAIVGCGAVGSFTADLLFRAGFRHLTLIDGERLRPGNVVRHLAGACQVGQLKTAAVRACLAAMNPDVAGVRLQGQLADLDGATALVRNHQVVVDATGSARATSLLASAAEQIGRQVGHTVISVCVQRRGDVLRVDRLPLRQNESYLEPLATIDDTPGERDQVVREPGCGSSVSPTPPGAVVAAAELAVRAVIDQVTFECVQPATVIDVRRAQPDEPYDRVGIVTSAPTSKKAAAS